jgi:nucleoid DNA-binding protein
LGRRKVSLSALAKKVSKRTGYPYAEAWAICDELVEVLVKELDAGRDVQIRRLGSFTWEESKGRTYRDVHTGRLKKYPSGLKLRLLPSLLLRRRRAKRKRRKLKWKNSE